MKNTYVKTVLYTMAVTLSVAFFVLSNIVLFAPKTMAKTFNQWGMEKLEYDCLHRIHKSSKNVNDIVYMFNLSLVYKIPSQTIYYGNKLVAHEDYENFVDFANAYNLSTPGNAENLQMANEDNRIKTRLLEALMKKGKRHQAFDFAYADFRKNAHMDDTEVSPFQPTTSFILYTYIQQYGKQGYGVSAALAGEIRNHLYIKLESIYEDLQDKSAFESKQYAKTLYQIAASLAKITDGDLQSQFETAATEWFNQF